MAWNRFPRHEHSIVQTGADVKAAWLSAMCWRAAVLLLQSKQAGSTKGKMVTPGRLELPTRSLGNCCSIHLSYGATCYNSLTMNELFLRFDTVFDCAILLVTNLVISSFSHRVDFSPFFFVERLVTETGTSRSTAARLCSGARCAYRIVIWMLLCPNSSPTMRRSTPAITSLLANVCRLQCQE